MTDGEAPADISALLRRLRALAVAEEPAPPPEPRWRDDLRLFLLAWAAGFLFFLMLIG